MMHLTHSGLVGQHSHIERQEEGMVEVAEMAEEMEEVEGMEGEDPQEQQETQKIEAMARS